jgi:hypothetical protein
MKNAADAATFAGVSQLLGLYGHLVDARDWDSFDELFLPDATLDYTAVHAPKVLHGRAEIRGYFEQANHPGAHHVSNIYVYIADGQVRAKSKFIAPFSRPSHDPLRWYGGDYDDVVVAIDGTWFFSHRTCTPRWQLGPERATSF